MVQWQHRALTSKSVSEHTYLSFAELTDPGSIPGFEKNSLSLLMSGFRLAAVLRGFHILSRRCQVSFLCAVLLLV
jgi:hypothetical protein